MCISFMLLGKIQKALKSIYISVTQALKCSVQATSIKFTFTTWNTEFSSCWMSTANTFLLIRVLQQWCRLMRWPQMLMTAVPCVSFTRSKTKALQEPRFKLWPPPNTSILLTPFDFTGENTVRVVVTSMPALRIIINIPKPIKIDTSKKTVLLYDRSSQPPVIVSQMSFIIPLENFICGKHCIFIKPLALCLQIPFNFEYINDINRCSLWKKCWDTASYSKSVPYPMLNMLALLILATLSPALQENQI